MIVAYVFNPGAWEAEADLLSLRTAWSTKFQDARATEKPFIKKQTVFCSY